MRFLVRGWVMSFSVFRRKGSDIWTAKIRVWSEAARDWIWVSRSTGCCDAASARKAAEEMVRLSGTVKMGTMTREKAVETVEYLCRLAGFPLSISTPMTFDFAREFAGSGGLAYKTAQKYKGVVDRFIAWAGKDRPLDAWTHGEIQRYYDLLHGELEHVSAYGHLRVLRSIWNRAQNLGLVKVNPASGVDSAAGMVTGLGADAGDDEDGKSALTAGEVAAVVRLLRRERGRFWEEYLLLTLLGWHTGHRIQDVLSLTSKNVKETADGALLVFTPAKTKGSTGFVARLPVPRLLHRLLVKLGDFKALGAKGNYNGRISNAFVDLLRRAGVDPLLRVRKSRNVHLKTFHSLRHGMVSRLVAGGISFEQAQMITGHASADVFKGYAHPDEGALRGALRAARRK